MSGDRFRPYRVDRRAISRSGVRTVLQFTHESLAIRVRHKLRSIDVIDVLSELFVLRGVPGHIRSDGPEFTAEAVQAWIAAVGSRTANIAPGSPWENYAAMKAKSTFPARNGLVSPTLKHGRPQSEGPVSPITPFYAKLALNRLVIRWMSAK